MASISGDFSSGLVSHWKFEETSGTRVDSHGSNDLTDNNTVGVATGVQGDGADFEAANSEYFSITDAAQTGLDLGSGGTDFTLSWWYKFESLPSSGAYHNFFWKWVSGTNNRQYILCIGNTSGVYKSSVLLSSSGGAGAYSTEVTITTSLSTGTWYHMAYVYDASATTLDFYVNGSLDCTHTSTPTSIYDGNGDVWIGQGQGYMDGVMDELSVWSTALSGANIATIYNSGSGIPYEAAGGPTANANFLAFM